MFTHNLDPVLATIGPLQIRYYGLLYVVGFVLGYFILKKISSMKKERIEDLLVYAGLYGILGARLLYVLVYNTSYYFSNPLEIVAVWHGGLSFHGSLLGALLGVYLFSKKYKMNLLVLLDSLAIPFSLAVGIGRIGNFINGELYGRATDVAWCVNFQNVVGCRHPWPLYEMLYMFIIFGILWKLKDKKARAGSIVGLFAILYSACRFISEFVREPDSQLGFIAFGLTMGQLLNIVLFAVGLLLLYRIHKNIKRRF
jgi:phosphatidylglycerol:prolipoprotein diacylglycerol transferase